MFINDVLCKSMPMNEVDALPSAGMRACDLIPDYESVALARQVVRSYSLDASRLLDVCRQSIVFDRIRDVSACLAAIAADADVTLLRVKNRMDPADDAVASGGYRDVNISLCIASAETARLGLDRHVCEVQLLLRCTAELKSDAGHRRYVECRNLRAD